VSKYFLTTGVLCAALLFLGADANLVEAGHGGGGGGGGGHGGGGGGRGGYGGGYGGYGRGGYGGYGGFGYGYGGFYGGGLYYGDYLTGGGYPGYYAPYAYPSPAPYYYPDPGVPYGSRVSPYAPTTSFYNGPPAAASPSRPALTGRQASIHVVLPDPQATVIFNGHTTTSTGSERFYHTPELTPGGSYNYKLRVTWMQDGQPVTQERTVAAIPGQTTDVVFTPTSSDVTPAVSVVK
jgi:uncharacterized protein (TIGR03000 family)